MSLFHSARGTQKKTEYLGNKAEVKLKTIFSLKQGQMIGKICKCLGSSSFARKNRDPMR